MKSFLLVMKEHFESVKLVFRLAIFDTKAEFSGHYFGLLWTVLNPLSQMLIYWLVFGIGIRGGEPVNGVPYLTWLLCGLVPWFFVSPSILKGAKSVSSRLSFASKMNFPMSILPAVSLLANMVPSLVMGAILMLHLAISGYLPEVQWLLLIYYFICMITFMHAFSLFNSTISVIFSDYQQILQAISRMLIFVTPIMWTTSTFNETLLKVLALNPFYYIIEGFRYALLPNQPQFNSVSITIYFWAVILLLYVAGSKLHMKYRKNFVDYL